MTHAARCELRLLSARGTSALAVLSLGGASGEELSAALRALGCARLPRMGAIALRTLQLGDGIVEEALVVRTREDEVELHTHGNPRLVDRVGEALRRAGVQLLTSAVRTDVDFAEDLRGQLLRVAREAPSRLGLEACLYQLGPDGILAHLAQDPQRARQSFWAEARERGRALEPFYRPRRVVMRGRPNAGKSTLFNLLFGRPRVRVGASPGLTRDSIEELVVLASGLPITLVDVAGERNTESELEAKAIGSAHRLRANADLVLHVIDASSGASSDAADEIFDEEARIYTHAGQVEAGARGALEAQLRETDCLCDLLQESPTRLQRRLDGVLRRALGVRRVEAGPAFVLGIGDLASASGA